ncbi:MAG: hypothetical protein SGPRY_004824, partial [Prymnesium sp.]
VYYWNTITNDVQWERPNQAPPPPPQNGTRESYGAADVFSSSELSEADSDWLQKHEVSLSKGCPPPLKTFEAANLPPNVMNEIRRAGFPSPSPIQGASWAPAMQGMDVVGIAKTGSGKTLGFLAPAFIRILRERKPIQEGPSTLVLAPTRELATQIQVREKDRSGEVECDKFGQSSGIYSSCVYGGAPKGGQLAELRRGVHIIIATPGRLNDFLEGRQVRLHQVNYVVMDEADRMLDMGFEPQIRKIMSNVPRGFQSLMYTATWPRDVRRLAAEFRRAPHQITIGTANEKLTANTSIEQRIVVLNSPLDRDNELIKAINTLAPGSRVLIFCSTKRTCDGLSRALSRQIGCNAIHGDKEQRERERVLADFKSGRAPILVATDVAARGLDIKDVKMVINYEFPPKTEDYIHRIGRTGRAGATGIAVSVVAVAVVTGVETGATVGAGTLGVVDTAEVVAAAVMVEVVGGMVVVAAAGMVEVVEGGANFEFSLPFIVDELFLLEIKTFLAKHQPQEGSAGLGDHFDFPSGIEFGRVLSCTRRSDGSK